MVKLLAVADPHLPIPPQGYGGTERILYEALQGLAKQGYEITLLGHPDSKIEGRVIGYSSSLGRGKLARGWLKWSFRRQLKQLLPQFDVLHAVCRLDYLLPALWHPIPKHYLFQNPITPDQMQMLQQNTQGRLVLSGCGKQMTLAHQHWGHWRPIHNATDVEKFTFVEQPRQPPYLAFLGRLTANKGVKQAIELARHAGLPLHLAGNLPNEPGSQDYFQREIQPHLDDKNVIYLGEMDDKQKQQHLGQALAFVNPVQWDEPFGIVTVEALACGTPVLACPRGELPYIVEHGVTGFLANEVQELAELVKRIPELSRSVCREQAVKRFCTPRMVEKYHEVLQWLLSSDEEVPARWQEP
ncbi:MAG TPA: glycosyltransferase [Gemmatales bacterium]|nr:glycosyltransferase [Gemmatales bacterium]